MTEAQIKASLKAGEVIIVRAKNGTCIPMFHWKPSAYHCTIAKTRVPGTFAYALMKKRIIVPETRGWYSEGRFRLNVNLRDRRGRFQARPCPDHQAPEQSK